jgi:ribonuclease T2
VPRRPRPASPPPSLVQPRAVSKTAAASSRPDTRASSGATLEAPGADAPFVPGVSEEDASCPDAGAESRSGCDDPIADGTPFDLWELARSWTPGFCASGGKRTCAKKECAPDAMVPALTLHGLWPSFSAPVEGASGGSEVATAPSTPRRASRASGVFWRQVSARGADSAVKGASSCFWPQNCGMPAWMRAESEPSPWRYDASLLPAGEENRALAPAWFADALGAHEWPKHGTCASWADSAGKVKGLDQEAYYRTTFDLARREGTPDALVDAAGGAVSLSDLQAMFGGKRFVALGCTSACELVQVVTCYKQGSGSLGDPVGPRERAECPCTGVRDSHYDNSCAEKHKCAEVKILSPEQAGCGGGRRPEKCAGKERCCPGVLGPLCAEDADCVGESGCARCAHSGHCTAEPREE